MFITLKYSTFLFILTVATFAGICTAAAVATPFDEACKKFCYTGAKLCKGYYDNDCRRTPFIKIDPVCNQNEVLLLKRDCNKEEKQACTNFYSAFKHSYNKIEDGRKGVIKCECDIDRKEPIKIARELVEFAAQGGFLRKCVYTFDVRDQTGPKKDPNTGELTDGGSLVVDKSCVMDVSNIRCSFSTPKNACLIPKGKVICESEESIKKYFGCVTKQTMNELRIIYKQDFDESRLLYPPCK